MKFCFVKDKSGFSLVELIVVVLIMAIVATGTAVAISTLYNADVERTAKKVTNLMKVARSKAIALDDTSTQVIVRLYKDASGDYKGGVFLHKTSDGTFHEYDESLVTEEKISNYKVDLTVSGKASSSGEATKSISSSVVDYYTKSTGGIIKQELDGVVYGLDDAGKPDEHRLYRDLIFSGSDTSRIIIVPATGKSYLD